MLSPADQVAQEDMNKIAQGAVAWTEENHALGGVCDFCATPIVESGGPIITFVAGSSVLSTMHAIDTQTGGIGAVTIVDDPYWAACPGCTAAVEIDEDGERLAAYVIENRNVERVGEIPYELVPTLRADLAALYNMLYKSGLRREDATS